MSQRGIVTLAVPIALAVLCFGFGYLLWRMPVKESTEKITPVVFQTSLTPDSIPAIDAPIFESVASADVYLADDGRGIVLSDGKRERFYPFQILVWHEIINDVFAGKPVLVTYDPLCASPAVFSRVLNGQTLTFGWSGGLWNNNLVMMDAETKTDWIQLTGTAIKQTNGMPPPLERLPSFVTTWGVWKRAHPQGDVLSRSTGSIRDYTRNPYADYAKTPAVWFPLSQTDARLGVKESVIGLAIGDQAKAYPEAVVKKATPVNDVIGGKSVQIVFDASLGTIRVFERGPNGKATAPIPFIQSYWFIWAAAHPGTDVYQP